MKKKKILNKIFHLEHFGKTGVEVQVPNNMGEKNKFYQ